MLLMYCNTVSVLTLPIFGIFDTRYDCPTNAGMLFFVKNLRRFILAIYVQYIRLVGKDRAGDVMTEYESKDNLCTILPELDILLRKQ